MAERAARQGAAEGAARPARGQARRASRPRSTRGAASSNRPSGAATRCTRCSSARPTGSPTGAWPPTRSTTGASSTSTTWPRCAWSDDEVFEATHALRARPGGQRAGVDGLRIDHPDGLHDPAQYFERLQDGYARRAGIVRPRLPSDSRPRARCTSWPRRSPRRTRTCRRPGPCTAPPATASPTSLNGAASSTPLGGPKFDAHLARLHRRRRRAFRRPSRTAAKRDVMRSAARLRARRCSPARCCASRAPTAARATTRFNALREALAEVVACFPVYRTYIVERAVGAGRRYIDWAVAQARAARADAPPTSSVFDFLRDALLGQRAWTAPTRRRAERRAALRHAVPAVHRAGDGQGRGGHRLLPLLPPGVAQRGGRRPGAVRHDGARVPRRQRRPRARWPHTMLATSTHDNKRSEDVRLRIDVLSEMPAAVAAARCGAGAAEPHARVRMVDGAPGAVGNDEYLLYQTLLGTLPVERARRRGAAGVPRAHRALHAEGGARGQGAHQLDQPGRGLRGGAAQASCARRWRRCGRQPVPRRAATRRGAVARLVRRAEQPQR